MQKNIAFLRHGLPALVIVTVTAALVHGEWDSVHAWVTNGPRWPAASVSYRINPNFVDAPAGTTSEQIAELRAGADAWKNDAQVNFDFSYAGTTAIATTAYDGTNTVYYSGADGGGALAVCNYWYSAGNLLQFDIQFYDRDNTYDFTWAKAPNGSQFDIRGVAAHEFGHALGMGHSAVGGATMYPSVAPGDTSGRTLSADDIAGVQTLYAVAAPTITDCSPNHGFVTGGTAVTINGTHFSANGLAVTFAGHPATSVTLVSPTQITCVAPSGSAGSVTVQVCSAGQCGSLASAYRYDSIRLIGNVTHGSVTQLEFNSPGEAGKHYQGLVSLGNNGIPLATYLSPSDTRSIPLTIDQLFIWPLIDPNSWFQNFYGTLNASSVNYGYFLVPSAPQVVGITFYFAFIVYDGTQLSGMSLVSNGISATAQ